MFSARVLSIGSVREDRLLVKAGNLGASGKKVNWKWMLTDKIFQSDLF